jgi:hypothetical protein
MAALGVFSKIFGWACVGVGLLLTAVGFAAFNENDDYFSATLLGIGAIFMYSVGYHFITTSV